VAELDEAATMSIMVAARATIAILDVFFRAIDLTITTSPFLD
jgi:hypothetical protein